MPHLLASLLLFATMTNGVSQNTAVNSQPAVSFKLFRQADRCAAMAIFGEGDKALVVSLESRPATIDYEMRVYAPGDLGDRPWTQGKYTLGAAKLDTDWVVAKPSSRAGTIIYWMDVTRPALEAAGLDPILKISIAPHPDDLMLPGLGKAIEMLDACSSELLERWGYSKESQKSLASFAKPRAPLGRYASPSDYPTPALSRGVEGDTYALIDVGTDGRASNCRIIRTSGNDEIDRTTCMIVTKRARYQPAKDATGKPVPAPYFLGFRWEIAK